MNYILGLGRADEIDAWYEGLGQQVDKALLVLEFIQLSTRATLHQQSRFAEQLQFAVCSTVAMPIPPDVGPMMTTTGANIVMMPASMSIVSPRRS
jgi:hypothetical protein